jgi:hypothetical protein
MRNRLFVGLVTLFFVLSAFLVTWYMKSDKTKTKLTVSIEVRGDLENAKITPREIAVKRGDVVTFLAEGIIVKKERGDKTINDVKVLPLTDLVYFTVPSEKEWYWLSSSDVPTAITIKQNGVIRFGLDYPRFKWIWQERFASHVKVNGRSQPGPAKLHVAISQKYPDHWVPAKQFARLGGPIAPIFPDAKVEKIPRNFDLIDKAREAGQTKEKHQYHPLTLPCAERRLL